MINHAKNQGTQLKICEDKEPEDYKFSSMTNLEGLGLECKERKKDYFMK